MKQIVIDSINEIDKHKKQLQKIKVWICSSACGKSYLCSLDDRFFDLDAYQWKLAAEGEKEYEKKAIEKMFELVQNNKIALNATHSYLLDFLHNNKIPFVLLYGKPEVEKEFIERMLHRGSGQEFVDRFGKISENYLRKTRDVRGTYKIETSCGEFASDYLWKVFGKPKKYIRFNSFDKEYKIAFIDLDGTLLDLNDELPDLAVSVIKQIKDKIKIVITTGRSVESTMPIVQKLGLNSKSNHVICANGAVVLNGLGEKIETKTISENNMQLFLKSFDENFLKNCYVNTLNGRFSFDEIENWKNVYKIVYKKEDSKTINPPTEIAEQFHFYQGDKLIQFVQKNCVKEYAVEKILNSLKISPQQAIAFGDGIEDLKMLTLVDCGIAVCNADWSIKNQAKYIADSNNDNGVAKALQIIFNL